MNETMTGRAEHLKWCKERALQYCDAGDNQNAFASFQSDMSKHPETENHIALKLMTQMYFAGHLNHFNAMRKFIEGFN